MDRLGWFYHDNDEQELEQALAVASANEVDVGRIEDWSTREGAREKFERFMARLRRRSGR